MSADARNTDKIMSDSRENTLLKLAAVVVVPVARHLLQEAGRGALRNRRRRSDLEGDGSVLASDGLGGDVAGSRLSTRRGGDVRSSARGGRGRVGACGPSSTRGRRGGRRRVVVVVVAVAVGILVVVVIIVVTLVVAVGVLTVIIVVTEVALTVLLLVAVTVVVLVVVAVEVSSGRVGRRRGVSRGGDRRGRPGRALHRGRGGMGSGRGSMGSGRSGSGGGVLIMLVVMVVVLVLALLLLLVFGSQLLSLLSGFLGSLLVGFLLLLVGLLLLLVLFGFLLLRLELVVGTGGGLGVVRLGLGDGLQRVVRAGRGGRRRSRRALGNVAEVFEHRLELARIEFLVIPGIDLSEVRKELTSLDFRHVVARLQFKVIVVTLHQFGIVPKMLLIHDY
jgi:hypothetical protein